MPSEPDAPRMSEVHIPLPEVALMDGERLLIPPGETVHQVILDLLHRRAVERGAPVRARVTDGPDAEPLVIEVATDGSSTVLPDGRDSGRSPEPAAPTEDRSGARVPVADIDKVNEALARDPRFASGLALALRERLTAEHGPEHPLTQEAYALEAYVAYMAGDHRRATELSLTVARVRCRQEDPRAARDLMRCAAAWQRMTDTTGLTSVVPELLELWRELAAKGRLGLDLVEARSVQRHLETLDSRPAGRGGLR